MRRLLVSVLALAVPMLSAQEPIKPLEKIETPAEATADDVPRERVDELVEGLGAKAFQAREDAFTALKKLGRGALPHLERHRDHTDAETRVRVRSLIEELRRSTDETLELPEDEELFEGLEPRRPGGIEVQPRDLGDIWRQLDRIFEDRGMTSRLGRPDDLLQRHRDLMERMERDMDSLSRGGLTLRLAPGGGASFSSSSSLMFGDARLTWSTTPEGVRLDVRRNGEEQSYAARDLEAFMAEHPEVYDEYKASGIFERTTFGFSVPGLGADPMTPPRFHAGGGLVDEIERLFGGLRGLRERPSRGGLVPLLPRQQRGAPNPPRLGVIVSMLTAEEAAGFGAAKAGAQGVKVTQVLPGSVAESMGLAVGDILVSLNGKPLNSVPDLIDGVQRAGAGGPVRLELVRDGKSRTFEGTLAGRRRLAPAAPKRIERDAEAPRRRRSRKL